MAEFREFPKIPRLSRRCIVTEKIDGTNGQIYIGLDEKGAREFLVGSRTRWITPETDNHGFAKWAYDHGEELIEGLGKGLHFGEWWGHGIQRGYGLKENRFSLFNTSRWVDRHFLPSDMAGCSLMEKQQFAPDCCYVVPIIMDNDFGMIDFSKVISRLRDHGSYAAPGFMQPEGIVVYHVSGNILFKKTILKDDVPKGKEKK